MKKPYCFIIPHGGYKVPEELSDLCQLDDLELFFEADTGANDCFNLHQIGTVIHTPIHRLFIDVDRDPYALPPRTQNGVIKTHSLQKKHIFEKGVFPDEIAIAGMIKRYWHPFHARIEHAIKTSRFVVVCHTVMPVAPPAAKDAGFPRPVITIENIVSNGADTITCEQEKTLKLLQLCKKAFAPEKYSATTPFCIGRPAHRYIMHRYAKNLIPTVRLSLSKALFLNEKYFDAENLTIDSQRMHSIKERFYDCFDAFSRFI